MAGLDLKGLIGKLNPVCQRALEGAAGLCLSRTNYNVEVEHWLTKLLEQPGNDICLLLKHFDIDQGRVLTDLTKAIDRLKTGNARPPLLSPEVCDLIKQAWLIASVDFGDEKVRGAWLLVALLSDESLSQRLLAASDEFRRISPDVLRREASRVFPRSTESDFMPGGAASGNASAGDAATGADGKPRGPTKTRSTSPAARRRAKSIRCSAARLKCGRSSISSPAGGRTTRFSPARPALAKRQSWKDSPSGSPTAMCLSR